MNHYRKTAVLYNSRKKSDDTLDICVFCKKEQDPVPLRETSLSFIVENRTKYDVWEGHKVAEHYMVIPKKHVESFFELTDNEKLDIMNIIAAYESQGFNVYARGVNSPRRSVKHQHTHLIKFASDKRPRASLFIEKPYVLLTVR